jgi:hypothetical protein
MGCEPDPSTTSPPTEGQVIHGEAQVEKVDVVIRESFPVQIHAIARGNLPNGCTTIEEIIQDREGDMFKLTLTTSRPTDQACTEALVPFEATIPLDVLNLDAGTYTVTVDQVSDSFELAVDNIPQEPGMGAEPSEEVIVSKMAAVESIEIRILESSPVQVHVLTKGILTDGCTEIGEIIKEREGNSFHVRLTTVRPADAICTQELAPFEESVPLDVYGLPAGTYTVEVNGVTDSFELSVDNVLPADPTLSCPPARDGLMKVVIPSDGYCFLHPPLFEADSSQPGTLVITGPELDGPLRASLTIQKEGVANGRTAGEVIDERLSQFKASGADIQQSMISLGGEEAVSADVVLRGVQVRQVFLVHDGTAFLLTLAPVDADFPEATRQAKELWAVVQPSFTFMP